jgi:hypothetical protein
MARFTPLCNASTLSYPPAKGFSVLDTASSPPGCAWLNPSPKQFDDTCLLRFYPPLPLELPGFGTSPGSAHGWRSNCHLLIGLSNPPVAIQNPSHAPMESPGPISVPWRPIQSQAEPPRHPRFLGAGPVPVLNRGVWRPPATPSGKGSRDCALPGTANSDPLWPPVCETTDA